MGWKTGFEPATSGITIQRSNQLSYNHHNLPREEDLRKPPDVTGAASLKSDAKVN